LSSTPTPSNAFLRWVLVNPAIITTSLERARPFNGLLLSHVSWLSFFLVTIKVCLAGLSGMRTLERRLDTQEKDLRVSSLVFSESQPDLSMTTGLIVSSNLGCFTGCILAFLGCERTGRRWAMWIAMGFIIVRLAFDMIVVRADSQRPAVSCRPVLTACHILWYVRIIEDGAHLRSVVSLLVSEPASKRPLYPCINRSYASLKSVDELSRLNRCLSVSASRSPIGSITE
jgi:hypothetical protein